MNWIFSIYDADDGGRFQKNHFLLHSQFCLQHRCGRDHGPGARPLQDLQDGGGHGQDCRLRPGPMFYPTKMFAILQQPKNDSFLDELAFTLSIF